MSAEVTKPIPKSLHTVTVLVRVATHLRDHHVSNADAVAAALDLLGYTDTNQPDTHGVVAAALKIMDAAK